MRTSTLLGSLALHLAGAALAVPHRSMLPRDTASGLNVVYWGQNGGGTIENNDLSTYCTDTSGIDILVLAFLYEYGSTGDIPGGTIGQSCFITDTGEGQNCDDLASEITTCQDAGVKIILSLGGSEGSYSLTSDSQAQTIAQNLWASYGPSGNASAQRPLGDVVVDGFDFDIEVNDGSEYYPAMITELRSLFETDTSKDYYITGAPQCPLPEPNMGVIIGNATFDYLWVQFYNNDDYEEDPCSLGLGDNAPFNYDNWTAFLETTPSSDAKLFIGVPAAPLAANGAPSGEEYYATPSQLATLVSEYKSNSYFGGIMMWSAGFSDSNVNDNCTYAQEAYNILLTGEPCSSGPATMSLSTIAPTSTSTSTAPASTATGTVEEWGQCGGEGYTGSTVCASPYTCVEQSVWWSSCQ